MKLHPISEQNNFIMAWIPEKHDDVSICDELIEFFEDNPDYHNQGLIYDQSGTKVLNKEIKNSIDLPMRMMPEYLKKEYYDYLTRCCEEYKLKYPTLNFLDPWVITEGNIQKYSPGGGYFQWHCERMAGSTKNNSSNRVLTWMTFLNDVEDGGETEFWYHGKIKAVKGLTVIWGVDHDTMHRGVVSPTETKYIATGWYSYV